ncbi:unnamed protein product [Aureobasidium uvarum]|uniref:Apple domain-containing protein n=1 Tax=Aureobasidium uvarum TaxID=2773716 RepID=A0A9N8KXV0_9PEZI|nr:unnamed protein product [Aureobasidium uvarum]
MTSALLLFAIISTAVAAQIGRRHPYGIYPGPSITASSSSVSHVEASQGVPTSDLLQSSMIASSSEYSSSASMINNTSSSVSLPTDTSTSAFDTTTSSSLLTSTMSGPPLSFTTNSNGTSVPATSTTSTEGSSSETAATTTSAAAPRETTCVAVAINNIGANGECGCDYDVYTCLERLSNLSEWSISQTTSSFNGCMQACDSQPTCYSFTFQISNGLCRMFGGMLNGGDGTVAAPDFISGEVVKGTCTGHCDGS